VFLGSNQESSCRYTYYVTWLIAIQDFRTYSLASWPIPLAHLNKLLSPLPNWLPQLLIPQVLKAFK
jgi:hypothetical protein